MFKKIFSRYFTIYYIAQLMVILTLAFAFIFLQGCTAIPILGQQLPALSIRGDQMGIRYTCSNVNNATKQQPVCSIGLP